MTLVTTQNTGYLEDDYLEEPYLGGSNFGNSGIQFLAIIDAQDAEGLQFRAIINDEDAEGVQWLGTIDAQDAEGTQFFADLNTRYNAGTQFQGTIDAQFFSGLQFRAVLDAQDATGTQAHVTINTTDASGVQFHVQVDNYLAPRGLEFRSDNGITHIVCPDVGYLAEPYLGGPYLAEGFCAHSGIQFRAVLNEEDAEGLQFRGTIDAQDATGTQFRGIINATDATGLQFEAIQAPATGMQFNVVLYNTDNLRILCDFPSRGTSGMNWTANGTAAGDFNVNNLNTDIVEQVWRSTAVTGVLLTSDTEVPQGIFLDTLAILGHNLTTSASVTFLGSNDPTFTVIGMTIPLQVIDEENLYYIAADFPLSGFRYWRFQIEDPSNPDGYLQIGIIIFGTSVIFQGECFVDQIEYGLQDFADTVATAGHTNVANSRALKKILGLEFRSLAHVRGNFQKMRQIFRHDRTVLKCLYIPTPDPVDQTYTARYAVFGKLTTIPRETHNNKGNRSDWANFSIEVDESK